MGAIRTLIRDLAGERGIEIDDAELEALGLPDEHDEDNEQHVPDDVLSEPLPGTAAGRIELFLAADSTTVKEPVVKDGLMWHPIIREGQWALRPGAAGTKRRVPLKIIKGNSKNPRRQLGLQDLVDAFDDEAVQHVTVPTSHANTLLENQGFIKGMKIIKGEVKNKVTGKKEIVDVLMGGYDITEPEAKGKMERGTWANRSAGILYDYVNTETGKKYPAVIEHVAITNRPWITGMASFGRKLAGSATLDTVGLSLSDEGPTDDEYVLALSQEGELSDDDSDFLATESGDWSKEGSPNWLRQQVSSVLDDARREKMAAQRAARPGNGMLSYVEDYPLCYRCVEAKPGMALIADGYGDDSNFWAAPITVKNGAVEVETFDKWSSLKKAFIPDERPAPPADKLPLDDEQERDNGAHKPQPKSRIELAQEARRHRGRPGAETDNNTREVVDNMGEGSGTLQLSEEAQRAIQAADARTEAVRQENLKLSEKVARLTGSVQGSEVETYIGWLKDPEKGLGLSEDKGFGGVLVEVRQLMLADDGEPALQGDHFADDGNSSGELTLSDAIKRIFGAFEKVQEGKAKIGEQLSEPADGEKPETKLGPDGKPIEGSTELDEHGKPIGKPGAGEPEGESLSTEERVKQIRAASPAVAAVLGGSSTPVPLITTPNGGDA